MEMPQPGTRIRLIAMPNDPDPIPAGSEGTVTGGYESHHPSLTSQVWVDWDNGRSLCLLLGVDRFQIL